MHTKILPKLLIALVLLVQAATAAKPLKVYILAGQSNMQGSAHMSTFAAMADDPESAPLLGDIMDANGKPVICDNAWVTCSTNRRGTDVVLQGKVKVGYGFDDERLGPEYGFGITLDKALDEPVLIIKTAWGGKSLAVDFRPPGAGPYEPSAQEKERGNVPDAGEVGHYYREMMRFVRATLQNAESIGKIVPGYRAEQGYELAGFVWFQGWNDMCNRHHIAQYTDNMIHFIHDVRKDLKSPQLPFVVGVLGVYGTDPDRRKFDKGLPVSTFRKTQFEAVKQYDQRVEAPYRGKVRAVDSGLYYDLALSDIYWKRRLVGNWKQRLKKGEMTPAIFKEECARYDFGDGELTAEEQRTWDREASNAEYHYLGSGRTFVRIGKAFAEAILETPAAKTPAAKAPIKIFLLSGQSNMTGRGALGDLNNPTADQQATLAKFAMDPANVGKYKFLHSGPNKTGTGWTIRDDVFITMGEWPHLKPGEEGFNAYAKHGGLAPYYGSRGNRGFGPELAIGHGLGDHYDETVLLVKVSFGGNSLAGNFRPPSSGGTVGDKYPLVIKAVRDAITHLPEIVPGYTEDQGYELAGFFWNQGLSDIAEPAASEYESNLANLIKDLRKELKTPALKTVVAVSGNWGWDLTELKKREMPEDKRTELFAAIRKVVGAQTAISKRPEFQGTVATAETRDFWRPREEFGGRGTDTHWQANGESYWLIGDAMAREMLTLLKSE